LCDGTNGAPDLRNKFVIGAGQTYAVNQTGGTKDAVVVAHTHTVNDPGHTHTTVQMIGDNNVDGVDSVTTRSGEHHNEARNTGASVTGISLSSEGVSGTDKNLPPYFALCYIMSTGVPSSAPQGTDLTPYALKDSPTFIGTPTAPTPATSDSSTKIATTAYVQAQIFPDLTTYAPKASPTFTGNPSGPTPTTGDNSTKLATTAFVKTAISNADTNLYITSGQTDSSDFFVYPPSGYTMSNLKGFIPSINGIWYAGGVDGNDTMRCYYTVLADKINVVTNNSEQRRNAIANWLAIWGKN
jgi:hypothetical protein